MTQKKLGTKITPIERTFDGAGKKILNYLCVSEQALVKEIANKTKIAQPNVSSYLKDMTKMGIVLLHRSGKYTYVSVNSKRLNQTREKYLQIKKLISEIYK